MPKKPRRSLTPFETAKKQYKTMTQIVQDEFRKCDAPGGCPNIVSIRDKPRGYSGPIFCALHRGDIEKSS